MPFPYVFEFPFGVLPAVQVLINDAIPDLVKGSPMINWRIEERSTARFTTVDSPGTVDYPRGTPVGIYDITDTLIFSGVIDTPDEKAMAPTGGIYHPISCIDNHYYADKRLVVASWAATDVDVIVTALHTDYLADEGIGIGAIDAPIAPEIAEVIFNYVSVAQALDALAEFAGFTWFIDENKDLYFIDRTTYPAPAVDTNDMLKGTPLLSEGNPLYRNRQYIRGGTALTSIPPAAGITETFVADNVQDSFTVGFPIALKPVIVDSGLGPQTVGIKGLDAPGAFEYYWNKGDATVYAALTPVIPNTVAVTYYGMYPLISLATNEGERVARQAIEGGTGIIESIADEAYHTTKEASTESGQAKIANYCRDAAKFTYQTITAGIKAGQLQSIDYPLLDLNLTDMLIESVTMRTMGGNLIIYDVKAVVGPVTGSWAKYFSSMLRRQDAIIHIGDTYLIALLQEIEALALAEVTAQYSDDFTGGLVNRWLNTPPVDEGFLCNVQHERLDLAEVPSLSSHATEDYDWDAADAEYSFATWG